DYFSMALRADGTVALWSTYSQLLTGIPGVVTNAVAISAGSAHALALVNDGRPLITRQPVGGTSWIVRNYTFTSAAVGAAPLSYQWQCNGTNVPNATNANLVLSGLTIGNSGTYQLLVSNALGVAASVPAPLVVANTSPTFYVNQIPSVTNY